MPFAPLLGHDANVERFQRALAAGRLPSTFLFVGKSGIGKRTFALRLAASLLCERQEEASLAPCGECSDCRQVMAGSHPDLEYVAKPADKSFIPIELFIGDREHRGREGLCHRLALKPTRGRRKVAIVDDADFFNIEGANCLLKALEEPPVGSVLILIATSLAKQLPTIRSRCQIVRFRPLETEHIARLLLKQGTCSDQAEAQKLAAVSEGSLETAATRREGGLGELETELLTALGQGAFHSAGLATAITKHSHAAGEGTSVRRGAFREVLAVAIGYYRRQMYMSCGASDLAVSPVGVVESTFPSGGCSGAEAAAACLECCLETQTRLDSNANLATLVECWADDLSGIALGRSPFDTE